MCPKLVEIVPNISQGRAQNCSADDFDGVCGYENLIILETVLASCTVHVNITLSRQAKIKSNEAF